MGRLSEKPGLFGIVVLTIDGVAQLVEYGLGPALGVLEVAEDADVAVAVDIGAEGVRVFALPVVEVASSEDIVNG